MGEINLYMPAFERKLLKNTFVHVTRTPRDFEALYVVQAAPVPIPIPRFLEMKLSENASLEAFQAAFDLEETVVRAPLNKKKMFLNQSTNSSYRMHLHRVESLRLVGSDASDTRSGGWSTFPKKKE